jgi:metal-sulfur cluster biosynthetic enzyme
MDKSLALDTIKIVEHPAINLTLHELGIISDIEIDENEVNVTFLFPFPNIPIADNLINSVAIPVQNLGFNFNHRIKIMDDQQRHHFLELEKQAWRG